MVEIPDPLPEDVDALLELLGALKRERQSFLRRTEDMERLIEKLEPITKRMEESSGEDG